jgi:hypothetical protein
MDLLTLAAACAIGAQSALFVPLGAGDGCAGTVRLGDTVVHDGDVPGSDPWAAYVAEASRRFGVPERWIREVMRAESGGLMSATSPAGAMGLMQVMPRTYAELHARYGLGANPYDPRDSILAGTAYLREMHDRYGSPGFLAAYNAGPERLDEHLATGRPLPAETRRYVADIARGIAAGPPDQPTAERSVMRLGVPMDRVLPAPDRDALFAIRIVAARDASDAAADRSDAPRTPISPPRSGASPAVSALPRRPNAAVPNAPEPPILRAIRQQDIERVERHVAARSGELFASKSGTPSTGTVQSNGRSGDRARDARPTTGVQDGGLFAPIRTARMTR